MWDSKTDTDIQNRLLDSVGEGEGGMIWENSIDTCILTIYEIDHQSKFNAWNRALKVSAGDNPEERDRKGGGRGFQDGGHIYTCGWFMSMYGKNHHNYKVISLQLK